MSITTISSREFNHDLGKAKLAAQRGPVFITDRGKPAHVLLSIEQFRKLSATQNRITDLLALEEPDELDSVIAPRRELPGPVDLA